MKITKRAKVMTGALALAGVATLTGGAYTAGGLTNADGASQFIGGEVSQSVTGDATLSDVVYAFTDASNSDVSSVKLTFGTFTEGSAVRVAMNGSTATADDVLCVAITDVDPEVVVHDFNCDISTTVQVSSLAVKVSAA